MTLIYSNYHDCIYKRIENTLTKSHILLIPEEAQSSKRDLMIKVIE